MQKITVSGFATRTMVLSYDSTHACVCVGDERFEFDIQSLWDLAMSAVLASTSYNPSMTRRKIEARAAYEALTTGAQDVPQEEKE